MSIDFSLLSSFSGGVFFLETNRDALGGIIKKQDDMAQIGERAIRYPPSLIRTCVACKKDLTAILLYNIIYRGVADVSIKILSRMKKETKP